MAPIARIARLELPRTPELSALRTPRRHPTIARLAEAEYAMARVAQPHAEIFLKAGLPAEFAARLGAVTDEMLASVQLRDASIGKVIGATSGVQDRIAEARRLVHVIDAFVRTALKDNASLLANWNGVKRVPKTRGSAVVTPNPTVVTPASAAPVTPPPVSMAA